MKYGYRKLPESAGQTLIVVALILIVLCAFAGLAIDVSYMYVVKNELQVAADAAALAGAPLLGDPNEIIQSAARAEAIAFALKNKAEGVSVEVVTDNSNVLSNANDITVGFFNPTTRVYTPNTTPVNAIQVRPQRTGGLTGNRGPVSLFWGKVFGWPFMSANANAVATSLPLATPGIVLCVQSCLSLATPADLILQKDPKSIPINNGMAWTNFGQDNTPIGRGSLVDQLIFGQIQAPPDLCGRCISTNNGVGVVLDDLQTVFQDKTLFAQDKDFDRQGNVIKWRVAIPIVDHVCSTGTTDCPPGAQGVNREPSNIVQLAIMEITSVTTTGSTKGVTIDKLQCVPCPTTVEELGRSGRVVLVK